MDADKLNGEKLYIRRRRKGDRIAVYSDGKQKSVKRLMIDMKIPQSLRDTVPLLATKEDVLAVLGYRISEKYKRSKKSERVLVVCYESE